MLRTAAISNWDKSTQCLSCFIIIAYCEYSLWLQFSPLKLARAMIGCIGSNCTGSCQYTLQAAITKTSFSEGHYSRNQFDIMILWRKILESFEMYIMEYEAFQYRCQYTMMNETIKIHFSFIIMHDRRHQVIFLISILLSRIL